MASFSRFDALAFIAELYPDFLDHQKEKEKEKERKLSPTSVLPQQLASPPTFAATPIRINQPPQERILLDLNHPTLPEEFMEIMDRLGITEGPVFVIQKKLTQSDMDDRQNRVSMPFKQVNEDFVKFLRPSEVDIVHNTQNGMNVHLIEPCGNVSYVPFKRWKMEKKTGNAKTSYLYIFNGTAWKQVKSRTKNNLKQGMQIQFWAFRCRDDLAYALVNKVPP